MRLNDLIQRLQEAQKNYGNIPVNIKQFNGTYSPYLDVVVEDWADPSSEEPQDNVCIVESYIKKGNL